MNTALRRVLRRSPLPLVGFLLGVIAVGLVGFRTLTVQAGYNCSSAASGNWNDTTTWTSCNGDYPHGQDTATINDGHTVTMSADVAVKATTVKKSGVLLTKGHSVDTKALAKEGSVYTDEITSKRTENSKTYDNGDGKLTFNASVGAVHYKTDYANPSSPWLDIDTAAYTDTPDYKIYDRMPIVVKVFKDKVGYEIRSRRSGAVTEVVLDGKPPSESDVTFDFEIQPDKVRLWKNLKTKNVSDFKWKVTEVVKKDGSYSLKFRDVPEAYDAAKDDVEIAVTKALIDAKSFYHTERFTGKTTGEKAGKLPQYPIRIDTDVNETVPSGTDDGLVYTPSNIDTTGASGFIGVFNSVTYSSFSRFTTVNIPAGANINSSNLTYNAYNTAGPATLNLYFNDADNATAPTSYADYYAKSITAPVSWPGGTWTNNVDVTSPDLSAILQTVINRPGWAANNALMLLTYGDGNANYKYHLVWLYEHSATLAPRLTVTYTLPPVISGTVYTAEDKSANIGAAKTVALSVNGGAKTTVETGAGGTFSFPASSWAANDTIALFLDGETEKASYVTQAADGTSDISGLELYTSHVMLSHQTAGPMTNTLLATADNVASPDLLVAVDGSNVATFTSGDQVWIISGKGYTPGGGVIAGSLNNAGILTPETNSITVVDPGTPFLNPGTFVAGSSTFKYAANAATTVTPADYHDLVVANTLNTITYDFNDAINNKAFYYNAGTAPPLVPSSGSYLAYGATAITNLKSDDGLRNIWSGNQYVYENLLYRFKVAQAAADISTINITWKGYDTLTYGYHVELNTWNTNSLSWNQWFTTTTGKTSDQTYTQGYSSNIANYLDANNYFNVSVAGGVYCFLKGTEVTLADGTYKNIEDIKVGDEVRAYDTNIKRQVNSQVTQVFHHPKEGMGQYYLSVVTASGRKIYVTPNHLLYVNGIWVDAGDMKQGDYLFDDATMADQIMSIEKVYEQVPTYNLEVEGAHNYYAEGILAHNKPASPFVYSYNGFSYAFEGDILAGFDAKEKENTSYNPLLNITTPHIKLSNEVHEIEHIDSLSLKVTDRQGDAVVEHELRPIAVKTLNQTIDDPVARKAYLDGISGDPSNLSRISADDQDYLVLNQGNEYYIDFEQFPDLPAGSTREIGIVSNGYYDTLHSIYENYVKVDVTNTPTFTVAAGTLNVAGDLTLGDGTHSLSFDTNVNDPIITISGSMVNSANSTFVASDSAALTVGGSWTNAGTFTHSSGSVTFNTGATAVISGATTFHDLTISHTAAKEVDFPTGGTEIINVDGAFTVGGHTANLIKLYSTSSGTKWHFHPTGTTSVDYADIRDGGCEAGAVLTTPTNSTNSLNNESCWVFGGGTDTDTHLQGNIHLKGDIHIK